MIVCFRIAFKVKWKCISGYVQKLSELCSVILLLACQTKTEILGRRTDQDFRRQYG